WDCKALSIPRKEILKRHSILCHPGEHNCQHIKETATIFRQWEPSNTDSAIKEPFDCSQETFL
ncbi:Hypothetical protein SMAX5B_021129, partial [Scophthalmus maximus]